MFLFTTIIFVIFLILWLKHLNRDYNLISLARRIKTVDGSPLEKSVPLACGFWGNSFDLSSSSLEQMFDYLRQFAKKYERNYILYFFLCPVYNIIDAENAELVLSDNRILKKGIVYTLLQPFLRTGLLTSTDKKWHNRRRLLTPTFHFNILTQFIEIFKRESVKFINILNGKLSDGALEAEISLSELIPRFTLNSICETALGVSLDESLDGDNYRQHITEVEEMLVKRIQNPFMAGFDMLYNKLSGGKSYLKFIVPIIVRECVSDLALPNNLLLPKGTQINIHIFDIHRNPKYYTNPDEFRPERFMLPESEKRHPFAFIPFSAGQRNCIGQKFAMLEIKTVLVHILKHFKLEAITQPDSFKFSAGLLIRTKTNIQLK
ncbi:hypothetical protein DOY81_012747 [Sarcophaga bullata]|nr:hypothetical protein DOY81_012747 [Sarcophaga bullata]